jgi:hypothetical protein
MRAAALLVVVAGCSAPQLPALDPGLPQPSLTAVHPALLLPGTRIDVTGDGFAAAGEATSQLELAGGFYASDGKRTAVDVRLPLTVVDATHAYAVAAGEWTRALPSAPGNARFEGSAIAIAASTLDGTTRVSPPLPALFTVAATLTPAMTSVAGGSIHVNDSVAITGTGFLLGNGEGDTHVIVSGCYTPEGTAPAATGCAGVSVHDVDVATVPAAAAPWDRTQTELVFSPALAGIHPGSFTGTIALRNQLADGTMLDGGSQPLALTVVKPAITAVSPTGASLGQYVDVAGAGFIGAAADEVTLLHLTGTFLAAGQTTAAPVDLTLVPAFGDGHHLRYVLDETDALGQVLDLRRASGTLTGQIAPLTRKGNDEVDGEATAVSLTLLPVKQVVYVRFLPSYRESLALYGLAAVDAAVQKRIFAVAARDYAGVNIEFRTTPPADFALYSQVDVEGPDPNALGLLGYDNSPGKDVGNMRLFDRIGGVNATTQSDGFPGYGGIFVDNFMGYSVHPASRVASLGLGTRDFDTIFDALRPDSGAPVSGPEARAGVAALADGHACLAAHPDRATSIACGVFTLGNLIGTTLTHEVGHSLGLADPTGELFHDPGDGKDRLMDAGGDRPLDERAELAGQGPGVFCSDEYRYLRVVLPAADATGGDAVTRPGCD